MHYGMKKSLESIKRYYYATMADSNDLDIQGVLNLEMFGWDEDGDGLIDIHTNDIANSVSLANMLSYASISLYLFISNSHYI